MLKIEIAQKLLRDNPDLTAAELKLQLKCSESYAYEVRRAILSKGIPQHRGPIIRICEQVFAARPEVVAQSLRDKPVAEIARILTRKLDRPITSQYVTGLLKFKITIKKSEQHRIRNLCK